MKKTVTCATLLGLAVPAFTATICMPIVNTNITVDGIVVGADIGGAGTVPPSCAGGQPDPGWGGVLGQGIPLAVGSPSSKSATLFLGTHKGAGAAMDKVYFAIHVENTPDFTTQDKLTVYFQADATGANWDPSKDFALVFDGVGQAAASPSADGCATPAGAVRYYQRDAANTTWVPQAAVPAGITFRTSFDFETAHDAETQLWELEVGVDVSALNIVQGGKIGIGAKLYTFETGVSAWTSFHYPTGLTPGGDSGIDYLPNQGGVTVSTLQQATVGNCGFDVVITSIKGTNATGLPGHFSLLSAGDFDGSGNATKLNHFTADIKFVDPSNLNSPVAVPNTGNVAFNILPWNGGFTGNFNMRNVSESFTALGQTQTVASFVWPRTLTEWNNGGAGAALVSSSTGPGGHACLQVDLSGFTADLPNGNQMQQNLSYASMSTIKESFIVSAPKEMRGYEPERDGLIEYIMRVHWDNLAAKSLTGTYPFKYKFTNSSALGLKNLRNGYYSMRLKPGETKKVLLEITGGVMPNPAVQYKLPATAGGTVLTPSSGTPPLDIPVKPGSMVSIVVVGMASINQTTYTPATSNANGYSDKELTQRTFLLRRGLFNPEDRVGAVIASCDAFRTAFVVGTDKTFAVPAGCSKLSLAVNNAAGLYNAAKGEFEINVIASDPVQLPTRLTARGSAANPQFGIPAEMQPGANLPQFIIDVGQRSKKRLTPTGYIAYAVYASHAGKPK